MSRRPFGSSAHSGGFGSHMSRAAPEAVMLQQQQGENPMAPAMLGGGLLPSKSSSASASSRLGNAGGSGMLGSGFPVAKQMGGGGGSGGGGSAGPRTVFGNVSNAQNGFKASTNPASAKHSNKSAGARPSLFMGAPLMQTAAAAARHPREELIEREYMAPPMEDLPYEPYDLGFDSYFRAMPQPQRRAGASTTLVTSSSLSSSLDVDALADFDPFADMDMPKDADFVEEPLSPMEMPADDEGQW
ncbi:hypothetical protein CAOG_02997 [Capsaspora owczarzaki ATCC 30864]|uniref:Uncharacterized protein n=1 Tax=Capsaspora owczarzaki (strain ATCC 30864) TaxID=595528 RepID=A0A0D2UA68_CAPO3|nr:hypothetical protein CAOG_02997 [Capsaspora owczarzaki ATCC 30864]KJE91951.1 hypothetical protein CAOG_002997 [Capsaspora owczarzaki ATCC 30864]|eukprot:XP_004363836.1 hypothetical protein CAOG_02997 [Capsaspora owczarzaki ATCC 30864]